MSTRAVVGICYVALVIAAFVFVWFHLRWIDHQQEKEEGLRCPQAQGEPGEEGPPGDEGKAA